VAEGTGHVIDPAGVARDALQGAVAAHGPGVLWNPVMLDDFCRDRLAGLPGEAVLINRAARSDVPAQLREQADAFVGVDAAIAAVAATLSATESLNETACVWVVTEFARALGYPVPGGTQPMIVAAQAPTPGPLPPPPGGSGGATSPLTAPGPAGAGGAGPPGFTLPIASTAGRPPPGRIFVNRDALGVAVAIVLVVGYLGIALAAHLSPFAKAASSSPTGPSGVSSSGGTDPPSGNSAPDPAATNPAPDPNADLAAGVFPRSLFRTA
jgi:hypothetical protein